MAKLTRKKTNLVLNTNTRLFIKVKSKNACCTEYVYHSCAAIGDLTKTRTQERVKLYLPSDTEYNKFDIIADIKNDEISGSSSISTNYNLGNSLLEKLFDDNCLFDAQIHIGKCTNPSIFSEFEQIIFLENIDVTSYNISNLFAATQSDVGAVTENIDFNYESMYSFYPPKPAILVASPVSDGPIIDSLTVCDDDCCDCEDSAGTYLVQLKVCTDPDCNCILPNCIKPRVLYRKNCKSSWQTFELLDADEAYFNNIVLNRNVYYSDEAKNYNYVNVKSFANATITQTIVENSLVTIPESFLAATEALYSADSMGTTVLLVGQSNIVKYDTLSKTYSMIPNPDSYQCVDVSFADNETAYISTEAGTILKLDLSDNSLTPSTIPVFGVVHHVKALSCCTFIAAVEDELYRVCDNISTKSLGIFGTVTALYNIGDIVYAATSRDNVTRLWLSADGGISFKLLLEDDLTGVTENLVTNISACETAPNSVTFAGAYGQDGFVEADLQAVTVTVDLTKFLTTTGFIFEDNKC